MTDLRAPLALALVALLAPIGWAVAQTWNATLTAFALCGLVLVLGIAAHGAGSAVGVALHDRRAGLPSIRMEAPPSTGYPVLDAMTAAQLRKLDAETVGLHSRAELARFGMEREIPIRDWRATAQAEEDGGWGE